MSDYGVREKKIVFNDTDKRHADLKIRLQHDSLTQGEFFRTIVTGYIEKDERIISYLYDWRETNKDHPKNRRRKSEKLLEDGRTLENKFGINKKELENIFDIIEEEHPDL